MDIKNKNSYRKEKLDINILKNNTYKLFNNENLKENQVFDYDFLTKRIMNLPIVLRMTLQRIHLMFPGIKTSTIYSIDEKKYFVAISEEEVINNDKFKELIKKEKEIYRKIKTNFDVEFYYSNHFELEEILKTMEPIW